MKIGPDNHIVGTDIQLCRLMLNTDSPESTLSVVLTKYLGIDGNTFTASAFLLLSIYGIFLLNRNESVSKIAPRIWYSLKHKSITCSCNIFHSLYEALQTIVRSLTDAMLCVVPFKRMNNCETLTKEEIESVRKLIRADQRSALFGTFKEIHDIELIIKQIPKLAITVDDLLVDVKKLEESIENVQDAIHSHTSPDSKKTIFSEYKNVLKNHNERLLALQHRVEQYIRDDKDVWFMLPAENDSISPGGEHINLRTTPTPMKNVKISEQIENRSIMNLKKNTSIGEELYSISRVKSDILNTKIDNILRSSINEAP